MRRRNLLISLIVITVIAFGSLTAVLATGTTPELGLDLQGGASVTLSPVGSNYTSAALDQIPELYRQRIDSLGVAEPEVTRQGNHIVVNLPGVKNKDDAIAQISVTGKVVFRPVLAQYNLLNVVGAPVSPCINTAAPTPAPATTTPAGGPTSVADTAAGSTPVSTGSSTAGPSDSTAGSAPTGTAPTGTATTTATATPSATTPASSPGSAPGAGRQPHIVPVTTLPGQSASSATTTASTASTATTTASSGTTTAGSVGETTAAPTTVPYTGPSTTAAPVAPVSPAQILTSTQADDPLKTVFLAENPTAARSCQIVDQLGPAFAYGEKAIGGASAVIDTATGQWVVSLTLKDGADGLGAWNNAAGLCFSKAAACKQGGMAIVLDHQVISAPVPSISVFSNTLQITGSFSEGRAKDLARILAYGATPVEMKIDTTEQVSATLGKNSLHAAIIAGLIGIALVMVFMLLYYRSLAFIVLAGIVVSGVLLWAIVALFSRQSGLRLSLSGITGIIVSVGVTVDSYVVFFERLKDEVRGGKTLKSSAFRGFKGAWRTILAADIVSLIGAVVLFWLSVGSVRGFAFFLGLSTAVDLLIAYTFTRPAVLLVAQSKRYRRGDVLGVHSGEAYAGGSA